MHFFDHIMIILVRPQHLENPDYIICRFAELRQAIEFFLHL